jgi:hypothetical protein
LPTAEINGRNILTESKKTILIMKDLGGFKAIKIQVEVLWVVM